MRYIEKLLARARDIRCQTVRYITGNVDYNPVKRCYTASGMLWDGKAVCEHNGAYTPFDCVLNAQTAGTHTLEVLADSSFDGRSALSVPNDYFTYGGITRGVELEYLPDACIERVAFVPRKTESGWLAQADVVLRALTQDAAVEGCVSIAGKTAAFAVELQPGAEAEITAQMDDLMQRRKSKQPVELPSAGSVFKRPEGYFAAKLIDDCGLRGLSVGDAQVSEKHAGFVINRGSARASDVLELMRQIRERVFETYGVELEPEIRILGEDAQ